MNTNKHKYLVSILWLCPSCSQATMSFMSARATWGLYRELHSAIAVTYTEPAAGHGVSREFQKPSNPVTRSKYLTTALEISAKITIAAFFVLLLYFQSRVWLSELIYVQLTLKASTCWYTGAALLQVPAASSGYLVNTLNHLTELRDSHG